MLSIMKELFVCFPILGKTAILLFSVILSMNFIIAFLPTFYPIKYWIILSISFKALVK